MRRIFVSTVAICMVTAGILALLEGLASVGIVASKSLGRLLNRGTVIDGFDAELGWIALPNLSVPNMYGDGMFVRTNSKGIREESEIPRGIAPSRVRVVCAGDSFTFGHGVANSGTWCYQLGNKQSNLESVNFGQVGYGVDQSYLLYRRLHADFEHQVVVFAFITDDFRRASLERFLGYAKPKFVVDSGELLLKNVPVPSGFLNNPRLIASIDALRELRLTELATWLLEDEHESPDAVSPHTQEVVKEIFLRLHELGKTHGRRVIFVYLPSSDYDYRSRNPELVAWREFLQEQAADHGWDFWDLMSNLDQLDLATARQLFDGHYSKSGNEYVASWIYEKLSALPEVKRIASE